MTHPTKAIYKWLIQDSVRVQYVTILLGTTTCADYTKGIFHPPLISEQPSTPKPSTYHRSLRLKLLTTTPLTPSHPSASHLIQPDMF